MRMADETSTYEYYLKSCSQKEQEVLSGFFAKLASRIHLSAHETRAMIEDYQKAMLYYHSRGYSLDKVLETIGLENIGDFYLKKPTEWYPLDNAAKVYPLSVSKNWMAIFRLAMHLKEDIVPEILQLALTFTIKRFPYFATTIREGIFWHYLDRVKKRYAIEKDPGLPCLTMDVSDSSKQMFRVQYAGKCISVEFFHVLTDGTGGVIFLKTLVGEYLRLLGINVPADEQVLDVNEPPCEPESANDFAKAEQAKKLSGLIDKPALQIDGERMKANQHQVLKWELESRRLKELSKQYNTTVTALMLAFIFLACQASTRSKRGRFQIQVPVNMRKFYDSKTLRNFSLYCLIKENADIECTFAELLKSIKKQIAFKAGKQTLNRTMLLTNRAVKILGFIPIVVKSTVARFVAAAFGDSMFTTTLSNMGIVRMPGVMAAHIDNMEFTLGPALSGKVNCALITVGEKTVLSVTKSTADPSFERHLEKVMSAYGLTMTSIRSDIHEKLCA